MPTLLQRFKALMGGHRLAFPFDASGPRHFASSYLGLPQPPDLPSDLTGVNQIVRRSELVYACIEKKSEAACDPEIVVERKTKKGEWERQAGHPLIALMNKPNPYEDGSSFRRSWVASQDFADCFYFEVVRNKAKQPMEIYPLNPANIQPQYQVKANGQGYELLYYYYTFAGLQLKLKPEEVVVYRRHGLTSVYAGVSPVMAALGAIDVNAAGIDYIRSFFLNDGTPSGLLKIKGKKMTDDEATGLQARWMSKFGLNGTQRRGVAVLDEMADYQAIGSKLNEAGLGELTEITEAQICGVLGVPPLLVYAYVGLKYTNQRASAREAQQDFWQNTMSPMMKAWREFITWHLLIEFENPEDIKAGNVRVNWDMAQVDAMQEDVDKIHSRAREDYKSGLLTLDEGRAHIGMPPAADPDLGESFIAVPVIDTMPAPVKAIRPPHASNGNGHLPTKEKKTLISTATH
jgi:HK97 family phage portal protein